MAKHEHFFHALYWHFGSYGPQDVHMHPCECGHELRGQGYLCDPEAAHEVVAYSNDTWYVVKPKRPKEPTDREETEP